VGGGGGSGTPKPNVGFLEFFDAKSPPPQNSDLIVVLFVDVRTTMSFLLAALIFRVQGEITGEAYG
jgi:hypothetical protein